MRASKSDGTPIGDLMPQRAIVAPRARSPGGSARLLLEQLIRPMIRPGLRGLIIITSPPGGGKTTALRHLKSVLPTEIPVSYFDAEDAESALDESSAGLAILGKSQPIASWAAIAVFELCPWNEDDCMEYLAAAHRDKCNSILNRLAADGATGLLTGSPQLLSLVMDTVAREDSGAGTREILRQFAWNLLLPGSGQHWWRYEPIRNAYNVEWIARQLCQGNVSVGLNVKPSVPLVADIAAAIIRRPEAIQRLEKSVNDEPMNRSTPMAASILIRVNPAWRPEIAGKINLAKAMLQNAQWAGSDLRQADLTRADFTHADLRSSQLTEVRATDARFAHANLSGAKLSSSLFIGAIFSFADISSVIAEKGEFWKADFEGANLTAAILSHATMNAVNLKDACLKGATLNGVVMANANVEGADFTEANLESIAINNMNLNQAIWNGTIFRNAKIMNCNFEGLEMPAVDFTQADLRGSLFTSSRIIRGKFFGANLQQTGLADIDWEYADLRDADLTNASFHLGSTRSGLVGSTIASEGSKTGFYTDEFNEQDFKSPEEIRKANLRGADLRGAKTDKTDFYLVDLREARFSIEQFEHFKRCGAILHAKTV